VLPERQDGQERLEGQEGQEELETQDDRDAFAPPATRSTTRR
jgi:hypothetical protein